MPELFDSFDTTEPDDATLRASELEGDSPASPCAIVVLVGWLTARGTYTETSRLFLAAGVLGGFTTFSAFSLDAVQMLERGDWGNVAAYVLGSVVVSMAALYAGLQIGRAFA
mgnify:CR=1 FL=1